MEKVLITGGAGFIGNQIIEQLYDNKNLELTVYDNFSKQIHGENYKDSYLYKNIKNKCKIIKGDVCNINKFEKALNDIDYVIHLAAETGTGQSMYEINKYTEVNIMGTSNLLDIISNKKLKIKKIILSSSRSVYGEGTYLCEDDGLVVPKSRDNELMKQGNYSNFCPKCGKKVELSKTKENSEINPISYYAYTKYAQEKMLETMCPVLDIDYTIFRYQNVYGAGQSLNNPYTGILSIFSKLLLKDKQLNIFEDGLESRDFIHVSDVARITIGALKNKNTNSRIINVGYGENISVLKVAEVLKEYYKSQSIINISGDFRKGDIRHNIADITLAKEICDFDPKIDFFSGIEEFSKWVLEQNLKNDPDEKDKFENSLKEMKINGLLIEKT